MTKTCNKCKEIKLLDCFYKQNKSKDGFDTQCKLCCAKLAKTWKQNNKERCKQLLLKWKVNNPNKVKNIVLKKRYKISLNDYNEMLLKQNHLCAVCFGQTVLVVDHCHKTGIVRGLLCGHCNKAAGMLRDNPLHCRQLALYLEADPKPESSKGSQTP